MDGHSPEKGGPNIPVDGPWETLPGLEDGLLVAGPAALPPLCACTSRTP